MFTICPLYLLIFSFSISLVWFAIIIDVYHLKGIDFWFILSFYDRIPSISILIPIMPNQTRNNTNPNTWVQISSGGVGVFSAKGWGSKNSICPSKPKKTNFLGGMSRDICRNIPGVPEKLGNPKKRKIQSWHSLFFVFLARNSCSFGAFGKILKPKKLCLLFVVFPVNGKIKISNRALVKAVYTVYYFEVPKCV